MTSKSTGLNPNIVIAFDLLDSNSNTFTYLLDEKSVVYDSLGKIITMNDIRVMDKIKVQTGKTTNGAYYARVITRLGDPEIS